MKKMMFLAFLIFALALCLVACTQTPEDTTAAATTTATTTAATTTAVTTTATTTAAPTLNNIPLASYTIVAEEGSEADAALLSDMIFKALGVRLPTAAEATGAAITLVRDDTLERMDRCVVTPVQNGIRAAAYGKDGTYLAAMGVRDLLAEAGGNATVSKSTNMKVADYQDTRTKKLFDKYGEQGGYTGTIRVAFLGGSLTQGKTAWTVPVVEALQEMYPDAYIESLNAGIGATDSELGAARLDKDILSKMSPDILFVDYAVNDGGFSEMDGDAILENGVYMESIIKQCRALPNPPIIIFLYFPTGRRLGEGTENWENGVALKEQLAEHYGIEGINVWEHFEALYLEQKGKNPALTYRDFLMQYYAPTDMTHPMDVGFAEFGKAIVNALKSDPIRYLTNRHNVGTYFEDYADVSDLTYTLLGTGDGGYTEDSAFVLEGGFHRHTTQTYEADDPRFVGSGRISAGQLATGVWQSDDGEDFKVTIETDANYLKLYGINSPKGMKVDILVNGEYAGTVNTNAANTYLYIGGVAIPYGDGHDIHTIEIIPSAENDPENTVFRFGYIVLGKFAEE